MTQEKKFQDLDLKDAFLFAAALEDPETCQLVIELVLGRPVGPVKVRVERSILFSKDFRYVRLDVCARDEVDISYNVEMQNSHKAELPKRSRYHQAQLDVASLKPGQSFLELRPSYVIFICTYDPFDRNLYRYTYEERCIETGMRLGDETQKIFLNTKGTNDSDVPQELIHFLNYVENSTDSFAEKTHDTKIQTLHQRVAALKHSRELEGAYMTMEELMRDSKEEGRQEEKALMKKLSSLMMADELANDIPRMISDDAFYEFMLEKYHLK